MKDMYNVIPSIYMAPHEWIRDDDKQLYCCSHCGVKVTFEFLDDPRLDDARKLTEYMSNKWRRDWDEIRDQKGTLPQIPTPPPDRLVKESGGERREQPPLARRPR